MICARLKTTGNRTFIPGRSLSPRKNIVADTGSPRFYKALSFLKEHCYEPIGINDLMQASQLSQRGLHKAFQKHVSQSPGRELRRMRIARAEDLLINSDHELKVIAQMCGYRSQNSFWVSFREVLGESPGKFRSRFRGFFSRHERGWHRSSATRDTARIRLLPK
jgi:AraC family transcriptional regulator, transcriptional activator FtrA